MFGAPIITLGGVISTLSVTNYGSIHGTAEGVWLNEVPGSTLTNYGTISSAPFVGVEGSSPGGTLPNPWGGRYGEGVLLSNGGTVNNKRGGTISGASNGVYIKYGGTVNNGGTISGADYYGVEISGGPGKVTNSGAITGGAIGVELDAGGTVNNQSKGTISGYTTITTGVEGGAAFGVVAVTGHGDERGRNQCKGALRRRRRRPRWR